MCAGKCFRKGAVAVTQLRIAAKLKGDKIQDVISFIQVSLLNQLGLQVNIAFAHDYTAIGYFHFLLLLGNLARSCVVKIHAK